VVPAGKKLKPEARNRLDAIRKFTELGSGWNVAMRDLEIRGAGELLGSSQHGQMISIGYSLFEDLIREEAQRLRGEGSPVSRQVRVEIPGDFYLPSAYVPDVTERIRIYRSVWKARSESDIDRWLDYLRDRFGDTGEPVENCALRARIGFLASEAGVEEVVVTSASARLVFAPGAEVDGRIDFPGRPSVKLEKTGRVIVTLGLRGIEEDARMDETLKLLRRLPRV